MVSVSMMDIPFPLSRRYLRSQKTLDPTRQELRLLDRGVTARARDAHDADVRNQTAVAAQLHLRPYRPRSRKT